MVNFQLEVIGTRLRILEPIQIELFEIVLNTLIAFTCDESQTKNFY